MSLFGNLFADGKAKIEKTDIEKRFNLIARVGQGSMSKVWRADDQIAGRFVAVKVLDKEKTLRYEKRFQGLSKPSEGEIALSLRHPNIVTTYEIGFTLESEMFLVMEYVEGSGLSLLVDLQSEQMTRYRTRYIIQIGEALKHFHQQGWIHRDICPRNIMVTEKNDIKLIDFGLAVPSTPDFRKPGNRTGTANYMAPELIKRRPTDQRIDVFSYAVTCFEMYAKRHPWDAAMTIDAVLHHINQPPLQLQDVVPGIDAEMAHVIMKGLETEPDQRWSNVDEMLAEFRRIETRLVKETQEFLTKKKQARPDKSKGAAKTSKPTAPTKSKRTADSQPVRATSNAPEPSDDEDEEILSLDVPTPESTAKPKSKKRKPASSEVEEPNG